MRKIPLYRSQQGILGHILGGWGISGTYFITSGQTYTPVQSGLNSVFGSSQQPYYDNGMVNAFYQTTDQALRPYLGNLAAPVTSVGIYAGDACNIFAFTGTEPICNPAIASSLVSLTALNPNTSTAVGLAAYTPAVVTIRTSASSQNTPTANTVFNTPFGNVARNSLRDAWTNIGNFQLFKTVKVKENFKVQFHIEHVERVQSSKLQLRGSVPG